MEKIIAGSMSMEEAFRTLNEKVTRKKCLNEYLSKNWVSPSIFKQLFKSKDAELCDEACSILYDWYSAEDAFSDFKSKKAFLDYVSDDVFNMFDAADSSYEVRIVVQAMSGVSIKDFVIQHLPDAHEEITGVRNPTAKQIWVDADATIDDYVEYFAAEYINATDSSDHIEYYIYNYNYINSLLADLLPDEADDVDEDMLTESVGNADIPAPYDKYFTVSDYDPEEFAGEYLVGDTIENYDSKLLAYLEVKPEYEDLFDGWALLVDDPEFPVVELAGGRMYPLEVSQIFGEAVEGSSEVEASEDEE